MIKRLLITLPFIFSTALLLPTSGAIAKERHPEMQHALHALENAKKDLEKSKHDFDGHRAKALDLTNQAIEEIKAGLASDKK